MGEHVAFFGRLLSSKLNTHVDLNDWEDFARDGAKVWLEKAAGPATRHNLVRVHPLKELRVDSLFEKVK